MFKRVMTYTTGLLFVAPIAAMAAIPVDTVTIDGIKTDLTAWGTALIGVALAFLGYKIVRRVVAR